MAFPGLNAAMPMTMDEAEWEKEPDSTKGTGFSSPFALAENLFTQEIPAHAQREPTQQATSARPIEAKSETESPPPQTPRPASGGLAALVVRQTTPLPPRASTSNGSEVLKPTLLPPEFQPPEFAAPSFTPPAFEPVVLEKASFEKLPLPQPFMPKTAIAACLATAAVLTPGELLANPPSPMHSRVSQPCLENPPQPSLQSDVEEMKNDLFGAVMGVSALKDRLDSLETLLLRLENAVNQHLTSPHPAPVSQEQVQQWLGEWLDDHLEARLKGSIESHLQSLSSPRYFRLGTTTPSHTRTTALTHAPVILDTLLP